MLLIGGWLFKHNVSDFQTTGRSGAVLWQGQARCLATQQRLRLMPSALEWCGRPVLLVSVQKAETKNGSTNVPVLPASKYVVGEVARIVVGLWYLCSRLVHAMNCTKLIVVLVSSVPRVGRIVERSCTLQSSLRLLPASTRRPPLYLSGCLPFPRR